MATNTAKYLDYEGLKTLWGKIKGQDTTTLNLAKAYTTQQIGNIKKTSTSTGSHGVSLAYSQTNGVVTETLSITPGTVTAGNDNFVTGGTVAAAIVDLTGAMHFKGAGATLPASGTAGDIYIITSGTNNGKEYVYTGSKWEELGDQGNHVLKSTQIIAGTGLTGGGALSGNVTLSLSDTSAASLEKADTALQAANITTGTTNGTIKVGTTDVPVKGLASAAYVTVDSINTTAKGYADTAEANAKADATSKANAVLGTASDASTAKTVYGAKKYAEEQITTMVSNQTGDKITVGGSGDYKDNNIAEAISTIDSRLDTLEAKPGLNKVGTVTSVGLSLPTTVFDVSNTPVTSTGTLTGTLKSQTKNTVFAGPSTGSAAAPAFRTLVANDIPTLTSSKISDFATSVQGTLVGGTSSVKDSTISAAINTLSTKANGVTVSGTSVTDGTNTFAVQSITDSEINTICV